MKQILFALFAALCAATPARAEIINLSCDNGGMLLTADTDAKTVTDKNPFQKTSVTVPLAITATGWHWHEGPENGESSADYALNLSTHRVSGTSGGPARREAIAFSNPQCGKSATPRAKPAAP
jgi:hypothetical protein